jgi:hypothetical protein
MEIDEMSMSWDGFRIDAGTLDAAMDIVDAFRPRALRMLHEWNARLVAETATALIDHAHARGAPPPPAPLCTAWTSIQDRRLAIVRTERRDPAVDPEFRLVILRHGSGIYGTVHTERTEWRRTWLEQPAIADFSWWDGTDRPDDVGAAEWKGRGRIWRTLVPDAWPAGNGCVVFLTPRYFESSPADVLEAMPGIGNRLRRTAVDLALAARMEQIAGTSDDISGLVAAAAEASCWMGTDEGIAERDRLIAELRLPEIDLAMLLGFGPENDTPEGQKE